MNTSKFSICLALNNLAPNSEWSMSDESYESLEWKSTDIPKPTKKEVEAELSRLDAEYDAKEYQRQRVAEYPLIVDQLDTLYHGGYDAWKATVQAVKDKYPKEPS